MMLLMNVFKNSFMIKLLMRLSLNRLINKFLKLLKILMLMRSKENLDRYLILKWNKYLLNNKYTNIYLINTSMII